MEQWDDKLAARVWQRVNHDSASDQMDISAEIQEFLLLEREDAHTYRQLAARQSNKYLQQLIRETNDSIAALEGLQRLLWGTPKEAAFSQGTPGLSSAAIRRCYLNTCLRTAQYSRHSSHSAAGPVFSQLAAGAFRRCNLLAMLAAEITD